MEKIVARFVVGFDRQAAELEVVDLESNGEGVAEDVMQLTVWREERGEFG